MDNGLCAVDCTDSYLISVNLQASEMDCVDVSLNSSVIFECVLLSDFISSVGYSNCSLEVFFNPGKYILTSYNIQINTSLSLLPVDLGTVTITCLDKDRIGNEINTTFLVNLGRGQLPSGHVVIKGIYFEQCAYQVRIDYAEELIVDNCTFR